MTIQDMQRSISKNALILGVFAALTVALVAVIQQGTAEPIREAQRLAKMAALAEILPTKSYDNSLLDMQITLDDPLLGNRAPTPAYIATLAGEPTAIILKATAPDGYNGAIELLIGIMADGRLSGVRVLQHKETPGLGDKIELSKSDWITHFTGKSLNNPRAERWTVKKERGDFDQFAGATITPRAVVKAVQRALQYFDANQANLFAQRLTASAQEANQ